MRLDNGTVVETIGATLAQVGDPVTVMLRPERLSPRADGAADGRAVSGAVRQVIFQGSELRLLVDLSDGTEVVATVEPDGATASLQTGAPIALGWGPDTPYLLHGALGHRRRHDHRRRRGAGHAGGQGSRHQAERHRAAAGAPFGRRALIVGGAVAGTAAVIGGVLAVTGGSSGGSGDDEDTAAAGGIGTGTDEVRILDWQAYIDPTEEGATGTIGRFAEETGIAVTYDEDFNDNNEVYNRVLAPVLGTGGVIDYDIVCPTNWMSARLKNLGWIEQRPLDRIPNRVNLEDRFLNQNWDYGAAFHLPWQAGITGIGYDPALTGREIRSIMDLFDPEFQGRVSDIRRCGTPSGSSCWASATTPASSTRTARSRRWT